MTRQLDTITTQLGTIQSIVATLPTSTALDCRLAPINASHRDLSQRVSAAPPLPVSAPTPAPIPPTSTTTHPARPPGQPRPKARAPPTTKAPPYSFDPDIPRYDMDTRAFYADPCPYADKFPDSGEANRSVKGITQTPPLSSLAISALTAPSPSPRTRRLPQEVPRRTRRIRAPSRPPKSRQPVTSSL